MVSSKMVDADSRAAVATSPTNYMAERHRNIPGYLLLVVSAFSYAIVPTASRLASFDEDNIIMVVTAQNILAAILAAALMPMSGIHMRIARGPMLLSLGVGAAYAAMLYGYVDSVQYIAVDIAIILFFIYPLAVGAIMLSWNGKGMNRLALLALAGAFVGLIFAIGPVAAALNIYGVALALLAMLAIVAVIIGNSVAMEKASSLAVAFYTMLGASACSVSVALLSDGASMPTSPAGWMGLGMTAFCSAIGAVTFILGQGRVGAARASMISNLEPVIAILLVTIILHEPLSSYQILGIAMVIGAIFLMEGSQLTATNSAVD